MRPFHNKGWAYYKKASAIVGTPGAYGEISFTPSTVNSLASPAQRVIAQTLLPSTSTVPISDVAIDSNSMETLEDDSTGNLAASDEMTVINPFKRKHGDTDPNDSSHCALPSGSSIRSMPSTIASGSGASGLAGAMTQLMAPSPQPSNTNLSRKRRTRDGKFHEFMDRVDSSIDRIALTLDKPEVQPPTVLGEAMKILKNEDIGVLEKTKVMKAFLKQKETAELYSQLEDDAGLRLAYVQEVLLKTEEESP